MSTISLDLVAEILSRLPINSVLCFRCVSTTWCALIDSPEFAKLHLNHSLETDTNRMLILREADNFQFKKHCFYCLDIDGSLNDRVVTPKVLKNPLKSPDFDTRILGSCNGLLLVSNDIDNAALWNPSTGKYKKLLILSLGSRKDGYIRFGFGYDVVNDDYKVVRIVQYFGNERVLFRTEVNVYSLKLNSWKKVAEEFPFCIHNQDDPGTYLNGALHWVASSKVHTARDVNEKVIVAFDLATEKFRVVPHPPRTYAQFTMTLEVLGGSLCACQSYWAELFVVNATILERELGQMDIWVMKEYGAKDSWTMIKSIEPVDKYIGHVVVPLVYSTSGEEILVEQDNKRFVWTSIEKESAKIIDTQFGMLRGLLFFSSYVYLGSLVQLGSSDDASYLKKQFSQDNGGQRKTSKKRGEDFLSEGFKLKL